MLLFIPSTAYKLQSISAKATRFFLSKTLERNLWGLFRFEWSWKSPQLYCPYTDGTPCQIGQCRRVGSRLFSDQSVHLSNQVNAFLVVHFVQYGKSRQPYPPYADGTLCQIGQCGRVGSRLFKSKRSFEQSSERFFSCIPFTHSCLILQHPFLLWG